MKNKVLVSACLLAQPVRYDGAAKTFHHPILEQWMAEGRLVAVCPERMAGMGIPREPAEISDGATGEDVLAGRARVFTAVGEDVTDAFVAGAKAALAAALANGCRCALLTDGSPSCGSRSIYDGSFAGRRHVGSGVTAALLRRHGIDVFSPEQIEELREILTA